MMQHCLILAVTVLLAFATNANAMDREKVEAMFFDHMQKYSLDFSDGKEFLHRLEVFEHSLRIIEEHNAKKDKTFTMGLNQFSHLTHAEFKETVNSKTIPPELRKRAPLHHGEPSTMVGVPESVNWVTAGAVTPVKNQAQCGCCWAFSTTGAMEGAFYIKNGQMPSYEGFSEEQLVACDSTCSACNGGWMDDAFEWIKSNGGITTEEQWPYTSGQGAVPACSSKSVTNVPGSTPSSYSDVQADSVSAMMSAVAQQPVSIAIEANSQSFQYYTSGVLSTDCGQQLDHGVLAVGYGSENGQDYWLVKNSWGSSWGENGYVKILRSSANLCGVLSAPSYPVL